MPGLYLNVDEVESALLIATSAPYSAFTQLIPLPNLTWENFQCHAIKIGNGSNPGRPGVYFLGGVHAGEWGSSDILINFVEQLEQAYLSGTGLTFGNKSFSAADIQTIVNTLDIIVFPQANPDGRNYSMNVDTMWRKNRRTAAPNSATCPGVDVNRNYDFLWDYPLYFSPNAPIRDSTDPCDYQLYNGPSAFSEPESRNAKWIFDTFPNIRFFIDLHSYGEYILYNWGDDEDQTTDPNMNFQNPAYNDQRGIQGDAYKEYIPSGDLSSAIDLANTFRDGIKAVRGTTYTVRPSFALYPTAGTSDDYAYSRHFVDGSKEKVIAFTLEWGTEFQPLYPTLDSEMAKIIQEITAGLLAYCLWVRNSLKRCTFIMERSTFGQDEIDARRKQLPNTPNGLPVQDAFRVVVDGFTAAELGIADSNSTLPDLPWLTDGGGITLQPNGNTSDSGSYGPEVQRFTFYYNIDFPDDTAFTFAGETKFVTLNVTAGGISAAPAQLELIKQPNPFILHGDPPWLSIDLRVFVVRESEPKFGVVGVSDAADAPRFIQEVMQKITPVQFETLSTDQEASALYLQPTDGSGKKVFNFALAKVHYIGTIDADHVRVFFRLLSTQSTNTAYDIPAGTNYPMMGSYRFWSDGTFGGKKIPLAGIGTGDKSNEYVTIPCFALPRVDTATTSMTMQEDSRTDGAGNVFGNVQKITPNSDGSEVDTFFGCWLDTNQPFKPNGDPNNPLPNNVLPINVVAGNEDGPFTAADAPKSIQEVIIHNGHQCLIAEIAFDPVEIPVGKDPSNWDKLAQRNIAWSPVGSAQAVSTFEIRPTPAAAIQSGQMPDELMIDWGNTPRESLATIYLPAVSVAEVLGMANRMYTTHRLEQVDDHTLQCPTGGITYIPIPVGTDTNYAGLLSVDLPERLDPGQVFNIAVRQVTNAFGKRPPEPPHIAMSSSVPTATSTVLPDMTWRRVLGAFQLTIPVQTKAELLEPEARQLSVLRWIQEAIPPDNRWYSVFNQYVGKIANRVDAFGGDSSQVEASPSGDWQKVRLCRTLAIICAVSLAVFIVALGIMTNWVAVAVIAVFLAAIALTWVIQCQPNICSKLRVIVAGAGIGALILAILVLLGASSPQLVPVLCGAVALTAIASVIGRSRKCF